MHRATASYRNSTAAPRVQTPTHQKLRLTAPHHLSVTSITATKRRSQRSAEWRLQNAMPWQDHSVIISKLHSVTDRNVTWLQRNTGTLPQRRASKPTRQIPLHYGPRCCTVTASSASHRCNASTANQDCCSTLCHDFTAQQGIGATDVHPRSDTASQRSGVTKAQR